MTEARFTPLSATDPRLSEWLDGRLPDAEAAQIARLVAASPELTRTVADLRQQKAALAALPASPPPARFVADVLAALDAAGGAADDDTAVEEEWRRIERERLDEEIAEAREDAAETVSEPMRNRWPWLALAGALAAGTLATVVINRPATIEDREVALAGGKQPADAWSDSDARRPAADGPTAGQYFESDKAVAGAGSAPPAAPALARSAEESLAGGQGQGEKQDVRDTALRAAPLSEAAREVAAAAPAPAGENQRRNRGDAQAVRSVTFRIRQVEDRQRLEALLAGSGLRRVTELPQGLPEAAKRVAAAAPQSEEPSATAPAQPPIERFEVVGTADAIAAFVAALEAPAAHKSGENPESAPLAAADRDAVQASQVRLQIEVCDETDGAEAGQEAP